MVVSDESKGKGNSEVLKSLLPEGGISGRPIVLYQDEGIQNTTVEEKPKDIKIKLHCLTINPVILPQLVALVHAPHELVVHWEDMAPAGLCHPDPCVGLWCLLADGCWWTSRTPVCGLATQSLQGCLSAGRPLHLSAPTTSRGLRRGIG